MINTWELFEHEDGWEAVSIRLDEAVDQALKDADNKIAFGGDMLKAVKEAFDFVHDVMSQPENADFGAGDSEPRDILSGKLARHMMQKYHVATTIDRFGRVSITNYDVII